MSGERLNPRMTDLHCWRETFPERLRGQGRGAEATRQAMVGLPLGSGSRPSHRSFDRLFSAKELSFGSTF